jgi:hypothetical protein
VLRLDAQTAGLRRSEAGSIAPARADSTIVFCGDAQEVSDGFALALEAMAANADSLMMTGTEGEVNLASDRPIGLKTWEQ